LDLGLEGIELMVINWSPDESEGQKARLIGGLRPVIPENEPITAIFPESR